MKFEKATLNDILNDYIVLRELEPVRKELSSFNVLKDKLGLASLPRKKDKEYAVVLLEILKSAKAFKNIVYIGDTFLSDLTVIKNLKSYGDVDIFGVITDEGAKDLESGVDFVVFSNSWGNLPNIVKDKINENSVVVVDIDKTFIGAHGRNHLPIDKARADAIVELAREMFDEANIEAFLKLYHSIHTKDFLNFTQDNQDVVSIVSLILYANVITFEDFVNFAKTHSFSDFIFSIDVKGKLKIYVDEVRKNLEENKPTLFPTFRKVELEKTIARMDFLLDETPLSTLLSEEILITGEVFRVCKFALEKGALVFGVSDKPKLASFDNEKSIFTKRMKIYP